jgi:hypothetical protein
MLRAVNNETLQSLDSRLARFLAHFFALDAENGEWGGEMVQRWAPWVEQLGHDCSCTSVLPLDAILYVENFWRARDDDKDVVAEDSALLKLSSYRPELVNILSTISSDDESLLIRDVCDYVMSRCKAVDAATVEYPQAVPQPLSYNPPKNGRFYAFSPTGEVVRDLPPFHIDLRGRGDKYSKYDDMCSCGGCEKAFDNRSNAITYQFLWFCGLHGHCYGGHIMINEGRKDPAFSLYQYCPKPPRVVAYDFGCSLEEFALNRMSGFFKRTRFYHDIFHGWKHKCSTAFKYGPVRVEGTNTSIAEQFNAFLAIIKRTAANMSQERYVFLVQFLISVWNERKEKDYQEKWRKLAVIASFKKT